MTYDYFLNEQNKIQELKIKDLEAIDSKIQELQDSKEAVHEKHKKAIDVVFAEYETSKKKEVEEFEAKIKKEKADAQIVSIIEEAVVTDKTNNGKKPVA